MRRTVRTLFVVLWSLSVALAAGAQAIAFTIEPLGRRW